MLKKLLSNLTLILIATNITSCNFWHHHDIPISKKKNDIYGYSKIGKPYFVENKKYYPRKIEKYSETGIASWYGSNFEGKKTANGSTFNKLELTAAHKTLPLPSIVRITNLDSDNNKNNTLLVVVNDRGPFSKGRLIDVSEKAAELLGFKEKGITRVRVELLVGHTKKLWSDLKKKKKNIKIDLIEEQNIRKNSKKKSKKALEVKKFIQVGTYSLISNAKKTVEKLSKFKDVNIHPVYIGKKTLYKVKIGPLKKSEAIEKDILNQVIILGYFDALFTTEKQ